MKRTTMTIFMLIFSATAFAGNTTVEKAVLNFKVKKAALNLKVNDTRTIVKEVENTDGNPCMFEGKSHQIELQVKQVSYDRIKNEAIYSWETVKTIVVDKAGEVMEVCAE